MGISAEVLKDPPGAIEGRLAIDDSLFTIELAPEWLKVFDWLEMTDKVGEFKSLRLEAFLKEVKELSLEQR